MLHQACLEHTIQSRAFDLGPHDPQTCRYCGPDSPAADLEADPADWGEWVDVWRWVPTSEADWELRLQALAYAVPDNPPIAELWGGA